MLVWIGKAMLQLTIAGGAIAVGVYGSQQVIERDPEYAASANQFIKMSIDRISRLAALAEDKAEEANREIDHILMTMADAETAKAVRKSSKLITPQQAQTVAQIYKEAQKSQPTPKLGNLSSHYESNGKPWAVGRDKTGGWSYGEYQIATLTGTFDDWMVWLSVNSPKHYRQLQQAGGSQAARRGKKIFRNTWKRIARNDKSFAQAQHNFIRDSHYLTLARRLKILGIDLNSQSDVFRDVVWSTAVQHGGNTNVIHLAVKRVGKSSERDLIKAIYAERSTRFKRSTRRVRQTVKKRFVKEERQALARLDIDH